MQVFILLFALHSGSTASVPRRYCQAKSTCPCSIEGIYVKRVSQCNDALDVSMGGMKDHRSKDELEDVERQATEIRCRVVAIIRDELLRMKGEGGVKGANIRNRKRLEMKEPGLMRVSAKRNFPNPYSCDWLPLPARMREREGVNDRRWFLS